MSVYNRCVEVHVITVYLGLAPSSFLFHSATLIPSDSERTAEHQLLSPAN